MDKYDERKSVADKILTVLQREILSGKYIPGQKLEPERKLAEKLNVNRTSLREALKRLEQLNLVKIRQGEGTTVLDYRETGNLNLLQSLLITEKGMDFDILQSILEMRMHLTTILASLAAIRRNKSHIQELHNVLDHMVILENKPEAFLEVEFEYYQALSNASKNIAYVFLLSGIKEIYIKNLAFFKLSRNRLSSYIKFYRELTDLIEKKDPVKAASRLERFLKRNDSEFIKSLKALQP